MQTTLKYLDKNMLVILCMMCLMMFIKKEGLTLMRLKHKVHKYLPLDLTMSKPNILCPHKNYFYMLRNNVM
jgi:hypothetical protein